MKYVCLLRGINVGGKNKVAMVDLRASFESIGFKNVSTYINSGNVIFETSKTAETTLIKTCEDIIMKTFGFDVVVTVISEKKFLNAIDNAPKWWGTGDTSIRSDALFVIPPKTPAEVQAEIQTKSDGPDQFEIHDPVLFWSLPMADYNKSVVPKIIGTPIYKSITIRSSTTSRKLADLLRA